jgi:hypothetical protein
MVVSALCCSRASESARKIAHARARATAFFASECAEMPFFKGFAAMSQLSAYLTTRKSPGAEENTG